MPKTPVHFKISNIPNEALLFLYLEQNNMKVTNEEMDGVVMVYDVEIVTE